MSKQRILVTGGAGYIGSHTALQLIEEGYEVVVLDNLERGFEEAVRRVEKLTGKKTEFRKADLRNPYEIREVVKEFEFYAVIHFAAYKDVGEADKDPEKFYENNVIGTFNLLKCMREFEVNKIVFSSTSAVYGNSKELPLTEESPIQPLNAYGRSKSAIEWMMDDYYKSFKFNSARLRYFNAAGAHPSGKIGEDPSYCGNVLPMIMQTLVGEREKFLLFGDQFETKDGTQERDYIHVMDLATAHIAALRKLDEEEGSYVYNLGTGKPTSVRTLIDLCQKEAGRELNFEVTNPRPGDPLVVYCDPQKANDELNWRAQYKVEEIVRDQWRWVYENPQGFG